MPFLSKTRTIASLGAILLAGGGRQHLFRSITAYRSMSPGTCPCCGFHGKFATAGLTARIGSLCPRCRSRERHRLLAIALERDFAEIAGRRVLHFAPEPIVKDMILKRGPAEYLTADIEPGRGDVQLDMERIELPDECFDLVVASHVLEHVDDRKALAELYRILRPGGDLLVMIPIIEGWEHTFEDESRTSPKERSLYFGQWDHVRYYGADFRDRVRDVGFELSEFTAGPIDSVQFRIERGSKVFLCRK